MDPETRNPKRSRAWEDESPPTAGQGNGEKEEDDLLLALSTPAGWVLSTISMQVELVSAALLSLSSPFLSLLFVILALSFRFTRACATALRRLALGLLGAAYAIGALIFLSALAFVLGVSLVRLWLDEPVLLRRPLYFDYTQSQPIAHAVLVGVGMNGRAVPAGHAVSVSLKLVVPESGFNRYVGVFQVSAEAISSKGQTVAASSQPCMLRFSSFPVRLMKTFITALPLLIGFHNESQLIMFEILRYKEGSKKTEMIKVRLAPRSRTSDLPQIYFAEIILCSQLPRTKELVRNWKWTFYVWISLYMYVMLLILVICCLKRRRRGAPERI